MSKISTKQKLFCLLVDYPVPVPLNNRNRIFKTNKTAMLSPLTQAAIAVLMDVHSKGITCRIQQHASFLKSLPELLLKLESGGLLRRIEGAEEGILTSYELTQELEDLSLLDILEATGEHLNCNQPTTEGLYYRYGPVGQKLGVVNHMTRLYLKEIRLIDL